MNTILWLLHGFCLFIGASALFVMVAVSFAVILFFYIHNWKTQLNPQKISICRITGPFSARWYISDRQKNIREFGMINLMVEELKLKRIIAIIPGRLPVWEIHHYDSRAHKETLISFFTKEVITVREGTEGLRYLNYTMTADRLRQSSFNDLVERAIEVQKDVEKRFKPILAKASVK